MSIQKIFLIAMRELRAFFTTWTGFVVIAVALFIDGLLFNAFAIGKEPKLSAQVLADFFYFASGISMTSGVFLAMRLMAEERQAGTAVLFYTSAVREREVIYGKFLSAFLFFLLLNVLTLYMPAMIFVNGKVSFGHLLSGYIGVILIGAVTLSATLFASVIAANQLVAGVLGAVISVTLLILWMLAPVVEPPIRDVLSYMAIHNNHFTPFSRGIIHTRDLIFYATIIFFFLECGVRALESRRWRG